MCHGKLTLFLGNGKGHVLVELYTVFGPVLLELGLDIYFHPVVQSSGHIAKIITKGARLAASDKVFCRCVRPFDCPDMNVFYSNPALASNCMSSVAVRPC